MSHSAQAILWGGVGACCSTIISLGPFRSNGCCQADQHHWPWWVAIPLGECFCFNASIVRFTWILKWSKLSQFKKTYLYLSRVKKQNMCSQLLVTLCEQRDSCNKLYCTCECRITAREWMDILFVCILMLKELFPVHPELISSLNIAVQTDQCHWTWQKWPTTQNERIS